MIDHGLLIPLLLLLVIGLFILLFMLIRRLKWLQSLKFPQIPFITSVYQRLVLRKYQTLQEDDCQSTTAYNITIESNQMVDRMKAVNSTQPDAFAQIMENKLNLSIPKVNRRRSSFNAEETAVQHCNTNAIVDFESMPKLRESRASSWSVADNKVESESLSSLSSLLMTCSFYDSHSTQSSPECTTSIDTTNFKRATSSDSLFSISSTADLNSAEQECGIIEIRPAYDRITNVLSVNIIQAFDIRNVPPNCSIFLVIFLLPYPKPLFKTKNVDNDDEQCSSGELQFALSYSPTVQRLTVILLKVRNVHNSEGRVPNAILIRVYLVSGPKVLRKKTSIQKIVDGGAEFNESIIFTVGQIQLNKAYLRASVREAHSMTEFSTIGHVTVGARRSGKELGHWQRMIDNSKSPCTMWHRLMMKKR
ncbi:Synaptotagmin-12 [Trichinella pseudospiralis]|uniref:Synaptotagmin-12 n=1 Tax=Trichinella pseudospiralis TaxID=6337 RepID=A0A0V1FND7_TRIPS|nr:Synaptotagmin-12 [Trichinella pseudospiralis]